MRTRSQRPATRSKPRQNLADRIVDDLGQRIVRGDFVRLGSLPTEPKLTAELGVSRNVLREAIRVLCSKGLIEVRPKTGTRIRVQDDWNVLDPDVLRWFSAHDTRLRSAHDFVEFRRIIEPMAAFLAALRATKADIAAIQGAYRALESCLGHPERVPATDILFHRSIYDASHNIELRHIGSAVAPLLQTQVSITIAPPGSFERGLPLHRKLTAAIADRDPRRAETIARQLVNMPYRDLNKRLHPNDRGLLE